MRNELQVLHEVITKLVPMLAGRGLQVTQRGDQAYVEIDPRTKKPRRVNIPNVSENASPEFVRAIQGFIDHEVGHILITDFDIYTPSPAEAADPKRKALMNLHNIVEDTMIEREMAKIFPGSYKNIADMRRLFIDKITAPAVKAAKDDRERFDYLLVPLMRALAGHVEFQEYMDANKFWDDARVKAIVDGLPAETKKNLPKLTKTSETFAVAKQLFDLMHVPAPPPPPAPPASSSKGDPGEADGKGKSEDKPDKKAGEGDGDGERDHSNADEDETEAGADAAPGDDEGEAGKGEPGDEEEDDAAGAAEAEQEDTDEPNDDGGDADADEDPAAGSEADGDVDAEPEPEQSDGDGSPEEDDADEEVDAEGDAAGDDGEEDEGEEPGAEEEDDADAEDAASGGDGAAEDGDDPAENGDDGDASGKAVGDAKSDASDGEDAGESGNGLKEEDDHAGSLDKLDENGDREDGTPDQYGLEMGKAMFDYDLDEFEGADTSSGIVAIIVKDAQAALKDCDYNVYSREFDRIEPVQVGKAMKDEWVPDLDRKVKHMTGRLQKDVERMMAAKNRVIRQSGKRAGKLHAPSLHRAKLGDDRLFYRKEVHTATNTAVSLLVDNSGSMGGAKMRTAMEAAYALSMTLERVKISHEILGFTTGDYGHVPRSVQESVYREMNEARSRGVIFHRYTPLVMPIYKSFDERITAEVRKRIAFMANAQVGLNGNIDGECLQYAADRLRRRTEERKVLIVLSDGAPVGHNAEPHLYKVVRELEEKRIETIGIGIGTDVVKRYYPKYVVLNKVEDLPGQVMGQLKKLLA